MSNPLPPDQEQHMTTQDTSRRGGPARLRPGGRGRVARGARGAATATPSQAALSRPCHPACGAARRGGLLRRRRGREGAELLLDEQRPPGRARRPRGARQRVLEQLHGPRPEPRRAQAGLPAGGGFPGAGGLSGGLTTGEVSYVSGSTLYVNSGENTVKVSAPAGTKVSKTVSTSVHSIHPGDTVVVRGSQRRQRQRHRQLDQHQLDRLRDRHQQLERIERHRRRRQLFGSG